MRSLQVPRATFLRFATIIATATASIWASIAAAPAFAVDPQRPFGDYIRTHFTTDDGLPGAVIDEIQQTPDGFLWMIVDGNGLVRFDGRRFFVLSGIRALSIAAAPDGDLWVGTKKGLLRFPPDSLRQSHPSPALSYDPGLSPSSDIDCLRFSRSGVLWVGTVQGLLRFEDGRFSPVGPRVWIQQIDEAANGHLLVATAAGFIELDGSQVVATAQIATRLGTRPEDIFHVMEDSQGRRWCCGAQGVARLSEGQWAKLAPYGPKGHAAFRAYEDAQCIVWVHGTAGLFRATAAGLELVIPGMQVRSLYGDRDGSLWVGTNGDGLYRFKDAAVQMFTTADGLPNDVIMTVLAARDGSIWTGANCGGLSRFDGTSFRTYDEKDGLSNSCVWSLAEDTNHDLWVGTWGGGAFLLHDGHFTQVLAGEVRSIAAAHDGSVWFATREGVFHLRDGGLQKYTKADGLPRSSTLKVFEDRNGTILTGSYGGVYRLVGQRFESLFRASETVALPMGEDRFGGLFVLFDGEPAALRVAGSRVDSLPELNGARDLVETASGELWFGGFGVRRVAADSSSWSRSRDEPLDFDFFGTLDGLTTTDVSVGDPNMALGSDGTVWVATPRGLAMFDPRHVSRSTEPSTVYITQVTVGRDARPAPRELVLPPGTGHMEVELAAVEITSPEKIRMQYRLDGVDAEWLDAAPDARAIYSNIPAGTHALHVRACNRNGVWDRAGVTYLIRQRPYFYQTSWFAALVAAAVVCATWFGFRWRLRQVTARLDSRFQERLAERVRIAGELHDTLLQGVISASMQLYLAVESIPADSPARGRAAQVRALMERVIDDARKSVQGLRTAEANTADLAHALSRVPEELGEGNRISFRVLVNGPPRALRPLLRDEVYRIGRESLLNAFRHSGADNIEVEVTYLGRELTLVVRDDGRGIDSATLHSGREGHWGLSGMRERAERVGARLTLRSRADAGTELELVVPGRVAFADSPPGLLHRLLQQSFLGRVRGRDRTER